MPLHSLAIKKRVTSKYRYMCMFTLRKCSIIHGTHWVYTTLSTRTNGLHKIYIIKMRAPHCKYTSHASNIWVVWSEVMKKSEKVYLIVSTTTIRQIYLSTNAWNICRYVIAFQFVSLSRRRSVSITGVLQIIPNTFQYNHSLEQDLGRLSLS